MSTASYAESVDISNTPALSLMLQTCSSMSASPRTSPARFQAHGKNL
jgi:hypothetical protein